MFMLYNAISHGCYRTSTHVNGCMSAFNWHQNWFVVEPLPPGIIWFAVEKIDSYCKNYQYLPLQSH